MSHLFASGAGTYPASDKVFTATARTANPTDVNFATMGARGLIVVIDVDAIVLTPTIVFTIKGVVDHGDGTETTWDILVSAAIVAVGTTVLQVAPDLLATANTKADSLVPDRVRIHAEHGDTDSITYSVTAILTP